MLNVEFIFDGQSAIIQSSPEEKLHDIFQRFANKSGVDLTSISFTYDGKVINNELTLSQIIENPPKDTIKIIVSKKSGPEINIDKSEKECSDLEIIYNTLEEIRDKIPEIRNVNFYKFLSSILLYEYNKNDFSNYRRLILKKILVKNDLIKNSSPLINSIIENAGIKCIPIEFEKNINNLKESKSPLISLLNEEKNEFLEQVIMNIFERKIIKYFELLPTNSKTGIILDKSFSIFKDTIKILDDISKENKEKNENLLKLYSIVYVKIYLHYLTYFIINNYQEINNNIPIIIQCVNDISNKEFSKVIKIYILKLIYNLKDVNYIEFKNCEFEKIGINFFKEIESLSKTNELVLSYNFLPAIKPEYQKYNEIVKAYMNNTILNKENKELENILKKCNLDLFLVFFLNKVISNLAIQDFDIKEEYTNLSEFVKIIFKNNNYSKELEELLFLFFDSNNYKKNIKPKIIKESGKIDSQIFEPLLYGFRLCANALNLNKAQKNDENNLLYPSLITERCQKILEEALIPGNDDDNINQDLHLTTLDSIKEHFDKYPEMIGCYVCSCGYYYTVDPPGFPCVSRNADCPVCGQKIGGGPKIIEDKGARNHGMVIRQGHYRIFKNKNQKMVQMKKWNDIDENIPNMTLDDYLTQVIEPLRKNPSTCSNRIKEYYIRKEKKTRNLSTIGYRLLNFITYSHLFYSFCIGKVPKEILEKYLIKDCDILDIIKINWDILKDALKEKNVGSVQIFINKIFKKLINLIKEYKISKDYKDRENFENKVETLILENLNSYPNYAESYEKNLKEDIDIANLKTLVTELIPTNSEKYVEKEYPMFKYFNYTKYRSEIDMYNGMTNKELYPLILKCIENNPDTRLLKYLPAFNEFTNYMVNNYSFIISREEAKNKSLENEEIVKEKEFDIKFNNFIEAWEHIKSKATKYLCRPDMAIKEGFNKNDKLINFLNDVNELNNGLYLASACQNFITWQNEFLKPIVDANINNGILHNYVKNISKKIGVQEAKPEQIVLIEERLKQNNYVDFEDVIYAFSKRNIFGNDGKINYSNYNSFIYDYDKIEEELGKIILPGVCLFKDESELNLMTYRDEGFKGKNSAILLEFIQKYPQVDLDINEKKEVFNYISNLIKAPNTYDFKDLYSSMLILLFYLEKQKDIKEDTLIHDIIKINSEKLKLSKDCINFFCNGGKNIPLKKMMDLFFCFEHLYFEELTKSLSLEYKAPIPEEIKNKIIEKLLNKKDLNDKINIKGLSAAIRRLISRYLVGKTTNLDINPDTELYLYLCKSDLWEEKIRNSDDLMDLIPEKIFEFKLKVKQAYEFYNLIGEEDRNEIKLN